MPLQRRSANHPKGKLVRRGDDLSETRGINHRKGNPLAHHLMKTWVLNFKLIVAKIDPWVFCVGLHSVQLEVLRCDHIFS